MAKFEYSKTDKILVTCALPYVNNVPHVGNIVGSHLPGDIFARFLKLRGLNALYVGGSDEHGTPITVAALKKGVTPKQLTDEYYIIHKKIYDWLRIGYDNFSRTSRKIHSQTTQDFYKEIEKNGYVSEKEVELPYCETCKKTLPDRYVEGKCPHCGADKARGDQCDACTKLLDIKELIKPYCITCGNTPIFKQQKHLFLNLKKLEPSIKKWIESKKNWNEQTRSEALGWIKEGLKERSITRDLNWGVSVPRKGYENKVFYVWFDAPIGYISATKELSKNWSNYWKGKNGKIIHFIGKDNIPFHTVWWGGMLIANKEYNLPYNVAGLQYCNYEGQKISKSKGWGVFCEKFEQAGLPSDTWRYYLTQLIPESKDTEFKWKEFQNKNNAELVGTIGNLHHRILTFAYKNLEGKIKTPSKPTSREKYYLTLSKKHEKEIIQLTETVRLREALKKILELHSEINKYLQDEKFWEKNRKEQERIIGTAATAAKDLTILLYPYLPESCEKILAHYNAKPAINQLGKRISVILKKLPQPAYPVIDDEKLEKTRSVVTKIEEEKKMVKYEDFEKLEIKTGTVKKVEKIEGADKLYKIQVDTGEERTIVSGIRQEYNEKDLVGKQIIVLTNLEPRNIKGVTSQGMLLAAEENGKAILLKPDKNAKNGSKIH